MRNHSSSKKNIANAVTCIMVVYSFLSISGSIFFTGCAHTVDYQVQHDTDTLVHHDTIPGPALVRFLSVLNNGTLSPIINITTKSPLNIDLFASADQYMRKQFYPIPHDSEFYLYTTYFISAGQKSDSIPIPSLKPYSMTTIALFKSSDPNDPDRLAPFFANDSLRKNIAPKDFCYVRLVNGLQDYPQPFPTVNMHLDDIHSVPLFKSTVGYKEIGNYILIPAGNHTIFVRSETDASQSYSANQLFVSGEFYTVRLTGKHADQSDQLIIDTE
jgi:hypothetical protein